MNVPRVPVRVVYVNSVVALRYKQPCNVMMKMNLELGRHDRIISKSRLYRTLSRTFINNQADKDGSMKVRVLTNSSKSGLETMDVKYLREGG